MDTEALEIYISKLIASQLPSCFRYHDLSHTLDVLAGVREFAPFSGIKGRGLAVLEAAALLHDIGYISGVSSGHEERSAAIARDVLPGFGFGADDVEEVVRLILVTRLSVLPAAADEYVIRDADVEYLGRECALARSEDLRQEFAACGKEYSDREWMILQRNFLNSLKLYSPGARELRQKKIIELREYYNHMESE